MFVILCFRDVNTAEQEAQENVAAQQNEAGDANAAGEEEKKGGLGDEETKGEEGKYCLRHRHRGRCFSVTPVDFEVVRCPKFSDDKEGGKTQLRGED